MAPPYTLPSLSGKTALVTGGASGIGLATTLLLSGAGCTVYIASRTPPSPLPENCIHHPLDLSTTPSAAASAASFLATHPDVTLDILIANAGIALDATTALSEEGWERHFQVNHLGHFAFVLALLPAVRREGIGRVVVISSDAHKFAPPLALESLRTAPPPGMGSAMRRYGGSKMASLLFASELARRGESEGLGVVAAVHPGTALGTGLGGGGEGLGVPKVVVGAVRRLGGFVGFSVKDAAMTGVWAATSQEVVEKGWARRKYLVPRVGWTGGWRGVDAVEPAGEGGSAEVAGKLWEWSEDAMRESGVWPKQGAAEVVAEEAAGEGDCV
ncbi:hypothetical protein EDC01DRAFT_708662 [Geopyxis carbonaria]|nr:hypothetical protein EDC01DRAFT_708662 [Geopyxis carbonaria]